MPNAPTAAQQPASPGERRRIEVQVLALQSSIAAFYCAFAALGIFPRDSEAWRWAVGWIAVYHLIHAGYVIGWRLRNRPNRLAEFFTPLGDISCITAGWVALGQPDSALWGLYLYALVGYSRRLHGRMYFLLALYMAANLAAGRSIMADGSSDAFDANLVTAIVLIGAVATLSSAIGNAWRGAEKQARLLAEVDPLTGVANRRTFLDGLREMEGDPRAKFAILMLDLDDFKKLNDGFGHIYGDQVLAKVAKALAANVREGDRLARYGGEEFIVVMPGAGLYEASTIADRLRTAVLNASPTSISVGCAAREPGEPVEEVVRRADDVLLAAKRNGKNRTVVSDAPPRAA